MNDTISNDEIKRMYSSNKEIAGHYDLNGNIKKTIEYSFMAIAEDPEELDCVTKIVYWGSALNDDNILFELLDMIRPTTKEHNSKQVQKAKEIYYRENRGKTLKDMLAKLHIDTVGKKQDILKQLRPSEINVADDMNKFYNAITNPDIYVLYDLYKAELIIVDELIKNLD